MAASSCITLHVLQLQMMMLLCLLLLKLPHSLAPDALHGCPLHLASALVIILASFSCVLHCFVQRRHAQLCR